MFNLSPSEKESLKDRIAKSLSEIMSDKHDCKITFQFVPNEEKEDKKVG